MSVYDSDVVTEHFAETLLANVNLPMCSVTNQGTVSTPFIKADCFLHPYEVALFYLAATYVTDEANNFDRGDCRFFRLLHWSTFAE